MLEEIQAFMEYLDNLIGSVHTDEADFNQVEVAFCKSAS